MTTAKPYKKRLLSSLDNHVTSMEVDTSDGTERNQTSPSSQEDSEKEIKEPIRTRRGWKKKVCRKQFRHHDIEIFKPGTNPTTCFLKKKDRSPPAVRKTEHSQTQLIDEGTVNFPGGHKLPIQNHQLGIQPQCKITPQKPTPPMKSCRTEENSTGRHHLPAIIHEVPKVRRKSIEEEHRVKMNYVNPNLLPGARRLSIDMPLLIDGKTVANDVQKNTCSKEVLAQEKEDINSNQSNSHVGKNNNKFCVTESMDWNTSNSPSKTQVTTVESKRYNRPMHAYKEYMQEFNYYSKVRECFEMTEMRMSEVPVDLSLKSAKDTRMENLETIYDLPPILRQNISENKKSLESQLFVPPTVLPKTMFTANVTHRVGTTNFRNLEEEINFYIFKINAIFRKDFSTNNLRKLCRSYQNLSKILTSCCTLPREIRYYIDNVLNETFTYISEKLKPVNLKTTDVLKILGTSEITPEKTNMITYLNKLFQRNGNTPSQTTSNSIQPQSKLVKPSRISPIEKCLKIRHQQKNEEFKQTLPRYTVSTPKYFTPEYPSKLNIDPNNWRNNSEILTPSPTSPNVGFSPPTMKHSTWVNASHELPFQSPHRPNSLPNMNNLELSESSQQREPVICPIENPLAKPIIKEPQKEPDKRQNRDKNGKIKEMNQDYTRKYLDDKNKLKPIGLRNVIVADTSMQITKETDKNEHKTDTTMDSFKDKKGKLTKSSEKMDTVPVPLLQASNNKTEIEFLNIIEKLKNEYPEEKMTELLLCQLRNTNKKRKVVLENLETIEITDSDSEDSKKEVSMSENSILNTSKDDRKLLTNNLETAAKTKLHIQTKIRLDNSIMQTLTPTSENSTVKKAIYSPEIEPISPAEEDQVFQFPEVPKNKSDIKETELTDQNNPKDVKSKTDYKADVSEAKRRKSEESNADRIAPCGKLCYIREQNIFLRYFDESQAKLFIKNSVLGDKSATDKTILNKDTPPSEKIKIPPQIEFSRKEDIPEPIEFVHELRLVEQFVPKDFAAFYRFVTGYQIVRNKNPVSLQTFLLMYNTNGISELLKKYLNTSEGDQMVPM